MKRIFTTLVLFLFSFYIIYGFELIDVTIKNLKTPSFCKIHYDKNVNLILHQGNTFEVRVETDESFQDQIQVFVQNETLYIKMLDDNIPEILNVHISCTDIETLKIYKFNSHQSVSEKLFSRFDFQKVSKIVLGMFLRM